MGGAEATGIMLKVRHPAIMRHVGADPGHRPGTRYASGEGRGGVGLTAVIWVRRYGVVPELHSRSAGM